MVHANGNVLVHLMVAYWVMVVPLRNRIFCLKFDQKIVEVRSVDLVIFIFKRGE